MPRSAAVNERIREEQRAKILDAARKLFARKGMAATMAEVATEASVSHGLVYHYFANKEAIFRELVERAMRSGIEIAHHALEMTGPPEERLHSLLVQTFEGLRHHPEFVLLIHQVLSDEATPDTFRELVVQQGQTSQNVMRQLIVEGQQAGQIAGEDPDQMVAAIQACLLGLALATTFQSPEQFQAHFPDVKIILRMLGCEWRSAPARVTMNT